jgi:hypothetical protein
VVLCRPRLLLRSVRAVSVAANANSVAIKHVKSASPDLVNNFPMTMTPPPSALPFEWRTEAPVLAPGELDRGGNLPVDST